MRRRATYSKYALNCALRHGFGRFSIAAAAIGFSSSSAQAQTSWTWTNFLGGDLDNPLNWLDGLLNQTPPSSSPLSTLVFDNSLFNSYTVNNNVSNLSLANLSFSQSTGTITISGIPLELHGMIGTPPVISVNDAGNVIFSGGINNFANGATGANLPVLVNLNSTGNLTISGVLGGNVTNGAGSFYGFHSAGSGAGTLTLSGSGNTGFWRFNNLNSVISGGDYILSSTALDTATAANSSLIIGSVAGPNTSTLTITNGTLLQMVSGTVGQAFGSSANLTVSGAGTVINAGTPQSGLPGGSGVITVGGNGSGNLVVEAGAVINSYFLNVAHFAGSSGNALITGSGSRVGVANDPLKMAASGQIIVGWRSSGCLTVADGGNLTGRNMFVGTGSGADAGNGTLRVDGVGSIVNLGGPLAQNTNGSLTISNGSAGSGTTFGRLEVVNGGVISVNQGAASTGTFFASVLANTQSNVTVSGAGSRLQAAHTFQTSAGKANIVVSDGGNITANSSVFLAVGPTGNTTLTVDGAGSSFSTGSFFQTWSGTANVNVANGASLTAASSILFSRSGTPTTNFTVTGSGSTATSGAAIISELGTTTIQVTDGGRMLAALNVCFGNTSTAISTTVLVDGPGSRITAGGSVQLRYGTTELNIRNGGNVTASGASIFIGPLAPGVNPTSLSVNVLDPDSILRTPFSIWVGGVSGVPGSPACMTVGDGGLILAGGNLALFSLGTVNVNAGGTLNVAALANGNSTNFGTINSEPGGLIRLGLASGTATFSGVVSGGGSILKEGAGTQVLTGSNLYSGGTVINAGILLANNAFGSATGAGPVTVQGTGMLAGNGTITGDITVLGGGTLTGGATGSTILTLLGNTLLSDGTLSIGINGTTPGSGPGAHDLISLGDTGTIHLGNISGDAFLITGLGYVPGESDVITFIEGSGTSQQIFGTFAGLPEGGSLEVGSFAGDTYSALIHYTDNSVYFDSFAPVPEPASIVLVSGGALGLWRWRRRVRRNKV